MDKAQDLEFRYRVNGQAFGLWAGVRGLDSRSDRRVSQGCKKGHAGCCRDGWRFFNYPKHWSATIFGRLLPFRVVPMCLSMHQSGSNTGRHIAKLV